MMFEDRPWHTGSSVLLPLSRLATFGQNQTGKNTNFACFDG
jgi:hypothetical protein